MPQRTMQESDCAIERLDALSGDGERLYRRLTVHCDDYGLFDGRPSVILGRCFPLQIGRLSPEQVETWLQEMVAHQVIRFYHVDGQRYLQMLVWNHRPRAKEPRYPAPWSQPTAAAKPPASVPSEPVNTLPVPSGQEPQGAVPVEEEEAPPEGIRQLQRCHEQHSARGVSPDDYVKLKAVLQDAADAGVEWQALLTIMREVQAEFKPTRTDPAIKSIGYYLGRWNAHIRAAGSEGSRHPPERPTGPRAEDTEDPADRLRRERAGWLGDANASAG